MLGLDFGTTNSAVALAGRAGAARLATFALDGRQTATFRSVLYFSPERSTYQEVERTKLALSEADRAAFLFDELPDTLAAPIARRDFEEWIDADLMRIAACVDRLLLRCGVPPAAVDRVFLTGGSSLVPSVRAIFADRFGAERVRGGDELITVARGLALIAAEA